MGTRRRKTTAEYKKMLPPEALSSCPDCKGRDGRFKIAYPDAAEAARVCREYKSTQRKSDPEWAHMNVYRCPKGHGFHVGHRKEISSPAERLDRDSRSHPKSRERAESSRIAKDFRPPPEWLDHAPEGAPKPAPSQAAPGSKHEKGSH